MRIAAVAAGAVGGYFGARMAAAGHEVHFIARGAHLEAIRKNGLKIESPLGNLHLKDARATDDPATVGPVDIVLFAVKLWDTEKAAEQAKPLVGNDTRVITLQNGVDSVERLAPILGEEAMVGGATYVVAKIASPGVIRHTGTYAHAPDDARTIDALRDASRLGASLGLAVHAGHGLTVGNVGPVAAIPECEELNIGHSIVSRAVFVGLEEAVREIRGAMDRARG